MTIVVSVRVNDGIVLASDSATTITNTQTGGVIKVYNHADKVFNLVKGLPIGAMTYGSGAIGPASISTLSKDLRRKFTPTTQKLADEIEPDSYTIFGVAQRCRDFFEAELHNQYPDGIQHFFMGYRVAGFSSGAALSEAWEVMITEKGVIGPTNLYQNDAFGPRWAGQTDALDRLLLGVSSTMMKVLESNGIDQEVASQVFYTLVSGLKTDLCLQSMPIQDAIDLAHYLAETAAKFAYFQYGAPTVGGAIEVATITKHEQFRWVSRKHYFNANLNGG